MFCNELLNDLKINAAIDEKEINTLGCYDSNTDNNNINVNYEKNNNVGTYTLVASIPHIHQYVYTIANAKLYPNMHTITCETCDYFRVSAHYSSDGDKICDLCWGLVGEDDIIGGNILSEDDDLINNDMLYILTENYKFEE